MPFLETLRAKAGAAILDVFRPGWQDEINLETLDLASCEVCVLGQLYGDFASGAERLFGSVEGGKFAAADRAGFDVVAGTTKYSRLNSAWRKEIKSRQQAA